MVEQAMVGYRFVEHLPDLINADEYAADPQGRTVRLQVRYSTAGVEIIGDAARPEELEQLLEGLRPEKIEQMLCG